MNANCRTRLSHLSETRYFIGVFRVAGRSGGTGKSAGLRAISPKVRQTAPTQSQRLTSALSHLFRPQFIPPRIGESMSELRVVWDTVPPSSHPKGSVPPVDEVVASWASVHIERLSDTQVWARIEMPDGRSMRLMFWTKRAHLYFGAEDDSECPENAAAKNCPNFEENQREISKLDTKGRF